MYGKNKLNDYPGTGQFMANPMLYTRGKCILNNESFKPVKFWFANRQPAPHNPFVKLFKLLKIIFKILHKALSLIYKVYELLQPHQ